MRFGARRRRCSRCHRTWRIRPKKRGRPPVRSRRSWLARVVVQGELLRYATGRYRGLSAQAISARFRRALRAYVQQPRVLVFPPGDLVLLMDGLWLQFAGQPWVLYLMALKTCHDQRAVFLDPVLVPGREDGLGWRRALDAIPPPLASRIRALVADNLTGMPKIAAERGWLLQLCHFHLISRLRARRGRVKPVSDRGHRELLYRLARQVIVEPDGPELTRLIRRIRRRARQPKGSRRLRMTASECVRRLEYYRAYLTSPHLHLPTTTNAVEAMAGRIRSMLRRIKQLRTPAAVLLWTTALIRLRPEVTCNSHSDQPNSFV